MVVQISSDLQTRSVEERSGLGISSSLIPHLLQAPNGKSGRRGRKPRAGSKHHHFIQRHLASLRHSAKHKHNRHKGPSYSRPIIYKSIPNSPPILAPSGNAAGGRGGGSRGEPGSSQEKRRGEREEEGGSESVPAGRVPEPFLTSHSVPLSPSPPLWEFGGGGSGAAGGTARKRGLLPCLTREVPRFPLSRCTDQEAKWAVQRSAASLAATTAFSGVALHCRRSSCR